MMLLLGVAEKSYTVGGEPSLRENVSYFPGQLGTHST